MPPEPFSILVSDPGRLEALASFAILDTVPERGFDDIAQLACRLCGTPVALVSLVAGDRQWFKARVNFPLCETDLNSSVCAFTLAEPAVLVIPDLTADPRTCANPLVTGEPFIRFYAGAPLRMEDGHVLGSLCVIDHAPRPEGLTADQADSLARLAHVVVDLIGLRGAVSSRDSVLARQHAELQRDHRLELLIEASAVLLAAPNPAAALLALLDTEAASLGFDQSYVYTVAPDRQHLALVHAIGADEATRAFLRYVSVDMPLCGIVAQTGQPLLLSRVQSSTEPRHQLGKASGLDAYAGYPIVSRGRLKGVISYGSTRTAAFDPQTLAFFAAITRLLSLAQERLDGEQDIRISEQRLNLAFQASAAVGWFDWDIQPDRLIANAKFAEMIGAEAAAFVAGTSVETFWNTVHPEDKPQVQALVMQAMETAGPYVAEYRVQHPSGAIRWLLASGHSYDDDQGRPARFPGILTDVTEARLGAERQTALTELSDRLRNAEGKSAIAAIAAEIIGRVLGLSRAGYCTVNVEEETVEVERDWMAPDMPSIAGRHHFRTYGSYIDQLKRGMTVLVRDVTTDPRTAAHAANLLVLRGRALINLPVMERGRFVGLFFALCGEPRDWTDAEITFLRAVADRTRAAIARAEAEDQQKLLNHEMSHRLKNTLAMVQSIATQTLRGVSERAPVEAFERRVHALASAHNVLVNQNWASASLEEVAVGVLQNAGAAERVDLDGPPVQLGARAALSLSLLLHELATNASKYGALSTPVGRVALQWRIQGGDGQGHIVMRWRETGGPPAVAPTRKGFGSRLIGLGLVGAGGVDLRYRPEGLWAEMRASLLELQQS